MAERSIDKREQYVGYATQRLQSGKSSDQYASVVLTG
jgi:hypothetical protein